MQLHRRSIAAALAVLLAGALLSGVPASADEHVPPPPHGGQLHEECRQSEDLPTDRDRTCRSLLSLLWNAAAFCRYTGAPEEACSRVDGRVISEARMQAYEASWVHRAHTLQRALDDATPLVHALLPATHNSHNAFAYFPPTLSQMDANHAYSMRDQLRMDMRSLELDIHWAPSVEGRPEHGMKAPILCHGLREQVGPTWVHPGCTWEPHLRHGLAEIRGWLEEDGNADEFLLLYLENHLDDDPVAHAEAAAVIEAELGDLVYRTPTGEPCANLPIHLSRDEIRAAGARILLTGNCDTSIAGPWGELVHDRGVGETWRESGHRGPYPEDCTQERLDREYDTTFIRFFEGDTWLQAMVSPGGEITEQDTRRMTACGVNLFGFDHLHPEDPRIEALIWSWAPDEPAVADGFAYRGEDGRFHADATGAEPRPYACLAADGSWFVSDNEGSWTQGSDACAVEGGSFAVPSTGWDNTRLGGVAGSEVWLNYAGTGGAWTPNAA